MVDQKATDPATELIQYKQTFGEEEARLTRRELEEIEDGILINALKNLSAAVDFAKIDPQNPDRVPDEWKKLPKRERQERMRIAQFASMSTNEAPFGLKLSTQIVTAIMQARLKRGDTGREFRAAHASLPTPAPVYPVIDESTDDD